LNALKTLLGKSFTKLDGSYLLLQDDVKEEMRGNSLYSLTLRRKIFSKAL
jgi:hypothetical protein